MAWGCTSANGNGSLMFINDVTRMNSEVYRAILPVYFECYLYCLLCISSHQVVTVGDFVLPFLKGVFFLNPKVTL